MKISIDKQTVTLAEVAEAKEMTVTYDYLADKDAILEAAARCLNAYGEKHNERFDGDHFGYVEGLIGTPSLTVIKNHFVLTVWCECLVKYWHDGYHMADLSFDLVRAYDNVGIDCFIQMYDKVASECI